MEGGDVEMRWYGWDMDRSNADGSELRTLAWLKKLAKKRPHLAKKRSNLAKKVRKFAKE